MAKLFVLGAVFLGILAGCGKREPAQTRSPAAGLPEGLLVGEAPKAARTVTQVIAEAQDGQEVVVFGRVGGRKEPFVNGRAVMIVIDRAVKSCADEGEDCPQPWDFCCETPEELARKSVAVQVVDSDGRPLKTGLAGAGGLAPLSEVTIAGVLQRSTDGKAVTINARQIHVGGGRR